MRHLPIIELVARLAVAAFAGVALGVERELRAHPAGVRTHALVASGIGFLGAGAILRQGLGVRGLTTAATLWLAAALGVASGAGEYVAVGVGTCVVLVVLVALRVAKPLFLRFGTPVTVVDDDDDPDGLRRVALHVATREVDQVQAVAEALRERPEVHAVRVRRADTEVA